MRAQGDRTPQALFGQAKQDWELAKLVNHPTHIDTDSPFAGTEMGAYMQAFAAKREARFVDFHARAQADSTDEVAQPELASPCEQTEQDFGDALGNLDTEIDRVSAQLETLRGEYYQANQAVEQLGKQCEQQEQVVRESAEEKNTRGFFGRLRHGKEDQAILDEAIRLRDKVAQHYDQAVDYRESFTTPIRQLETELDTLSTQRRDMQGLKKSMDFLDSLGMSATADDEMASRIYQQAAADNDYGNDQDNWLDNTPSDDGPEL